MSINFERSVLASLLWSNDMSMDTKDAFKIDPNVFTSEDRKMIAIKINQTTDTKDRFYGLLNLELQNTSQYEWLAISEQTPFPFSLAKKTYDRLYNEYVEGLM